MEAYLTKDPSLHTPLTTHTHPHIYLHTFLGEEGGVVFKVAWGGGIFIDFHVYV